MDVLTVLSSGAVGAVVTFCLMFAFYRFWILPYLTDITTSVPSSVQQLVLPYVDSKILEIETGIETKLTEMTKTVKTSSARFQRTVNQACNALDLDTVDLNTDEGIEQAKNQISKKYGADVALSAITQLIQSINNKKEKETPIW